MDPAHLYESRRLAAGYAYGRPPVHGPIIQAIKSRLGITTRVGRALDIGCGAGVSTAALEPVARSVAGLDPIAAMLAHRHDVAPYAHFVVGRAEQLPFADAAFDLMTAAGSVNYSDLALFLPEAARVLARHGTLAIYDFSVGTRLRDGADLERWHDAFERRHPSPPGYHLDPQRLPYEANGLRLDGYEALEVAVPMNSRSYLQYAMSEANVELAIAQGADEHAIREWCRTTIETIFEDVSRDVLFDAYITYVSRADRADAV